MRNLNDCYDRLFTIIGKHQLLLEKNSEDYLTGNLLSKEINELGEYLESVDEGFIFQYLEAIKKNPQIGGPLAIRIRKYDSRLAHGLYMNWYNLDKKKNWKAEFILDGWSDN